MTLSYFMLYWFDFDNIALRSLIQSHKGKSNLVEMRANKLRLGG